MPSGRGLFATNEPRDSVMIGDDYKFTSIAIIVTQTPR